MRKYVLIGFICFVICIALTGVLCNGNDSEVHVGIVVPLTGPYSNYGLQMYNGASLWTKLHPETRIRLFPGDGKGIPSASVSALQKMIMTENVKACIAGFSSPTLAMIPVAVKHEILLINVGAVNPNVKKNGKFVFSLIPDAEAEASYLASLVQKRIGVNTCFIFWLNDDSGRGMRDAFANAFNELGGSVVGEAALDRTEDIRQTLHKIMALKAMTVFLPVNGQNAVSILRQAYMLGMQDVQWVAPGFVECQELLDGLRELPGVKFIFSTYSFDSQSHSNARSDGFIKEYKKTYNQSPAYYSATCYDAMALISQAIDGGCRTSDEIADYVSHIKRFSGVSGDLDIDGRNHVTSGFSFKRFLNEHFERMD